MGEFAKFLAKVYHNCSSEDLASIEKEGMTGGSFSDKPISVPGKDRWIAVDLKDIPPYQYHRYGNVIAYEPKWDTSAVIPPDKITEVNRRGKFLRRLKDE